MKLIAALSENRCIGKGNKIPWHIPEDLKFFKDLTTNKTIFMGRKTWESLPIKPLPNRKNIILTKSIMMYNNFPNTYAYPSLSTAYEYEKEVYNTKDENMFVIGGGEIYRHALIQEYISDMYLTIVETEIDGDTFFPNIDISHWDVNLIARAKSGNLNYRIEHWQMKHFMRPYREDLH
jgi:dihydrofolate reductase